MTARLRFLAVAIAAALALGPSHAQERPRDEGGLFDAIRDRIEREVREGLGLARPEKSAPAGGLIDFEPIKGQDVSAGAPLTTQYKDSHGVVFGRGASVQRCSDAYDEFARSACPYPRAASGERAALHDVGAGGAAMSVTFARPASAIGVAINPTGGRPDEAFIAEIIGYDAAGNRVGRAIQRFAWRQDAFSWPTEIALQTKAPANFVRAEITLRRVLMNNQPVRFLIDDLVFETAPENGAPPVGARLDEQSAPPRAGRGTIVQSPRIGPAQDELQKYPAATRKRLSVDWAAAEADLARQDGLGLKPASPLRDGGNYVDLAELPVLLPASSDPETLMVFGNADTVNAVYRVGGRGYSAYGSRLVTVVNPAEGAPGVRSALTYSGTSDEMTASFSLYGVSYSISQHCLDGGESADPGCYDRSRLREGLDNLVVVLGDAGRARP